MCAGAGADGIAADGIFEAAAARVLKCPREGESTAKTSSGSSLPALRVIAGRYDKGDQLAYSTAQNAAR